VEEEGAMRDRNRILLLFLLFLLLFSLSKVTTTDTDHFQGKFHNGEDYQSSVFLRRRRGRQEWSGIFHLLFKILLDF